MEKFAKGLGYGVIGIGLTAIVALFTGLLVMWTWNWLMPMLFGLQTVNFIQGWGIAFLSGLLFKGTQQVQTKQ